MIYLLYEKDSQNISNGWNISKGCLKQGLTDYRIGHQIGPMFLLYLQNIGSVILASYSPMLKLTFLLFKSLLWYERLQIC